MQINYKNIYKNKTPTKPYKYILVIFKINLLKGKKNAIISKKNYSLLSAVNKYFIKIKISNLMPSFERKKIVIKIN